MAPQGRFRWTIARTGIVLIIVFQLLGREGYADSTQTAPASGSSQKTASKPKKPSKKTLPSPSRRMSSGPVASPSSSPSGIHPGAQGPGVAKVPVSPTEKRSGWRSTPSPGMEPMPSTPTVTAGTPSRAARNFFRWRTLFRKGNSTPECFFIPASPRRNIRGPGESRVFLRGITRPSSSCWGPCISV